MPIPLAVVGSSLFIAETTLTAMAKAVIALYGVASDINDFIDDHIEKMKKSDNSTISRTGRVIEGAKFGFGIGYIVPITAIAIGQLLLGNNLAAVSTLGSAAVATNPVAMTCAAIGAIYFGWNALSSSEQDELLVRIQEGMSIGVELVKSIITFIIGKTKEMLSADNFKEMKQFISDAAHSFGKTLADVTGAIKDRVMGTITSVRQTTVDASQVVQRTSVDAGQAVKRTAVEAAQVIAKTLRRDSN
jgi:hypothetical protein